MLKSLLRDKGYTATVVVTLALCVAVNTATFAIVNSVLLRPLAGPNADRIVLMANRYPRAGVAGLYTTSAAGGDYYDRLTAMPALTEQAMFRFDDMTMEISNTPQQVAGMSVTPSLFKVAGASAAVGRVFDPSEGSEGNQRKVILSDSLWRQLYGGDRAALGREMRLAGRAYTIVGVMPPGFVFVNPAIRFWIPIAFTAEQKTSHHNNNWYSVGLVKPGHTVAEVQSQVDAINRANNERFPGMKEALINAGFHTRVEPLRNMLVRDVESSLYLLWGGALFVLLIGALNIANLALARSSVRRRETAARLVLGASRMHLVRAVLTENGVLASMGVVLGVVLGEALLRGLTLDFPRSSEVRIDAVVVLTVLGLAMVVSLLIGILPLMQNLRVSLSSALQDGSRGGTGGTRARRVRQALVAAEIGVAFVLLTGAGLLLTSFRNLLNVDPGFTSKGVVTASTTAPSVRYAGEAQLRVLMSRILDSARRIPGVSAAGATTSIPLGGNFNDSVILAEGYKMRPSESVVSPVRMIVTPGYFQAMQVAVVKGRAFEERDNEKGVPVVIVDERLASKFWPNQDPIGRRIFEPEDVQNLTRTDAKTRFIEVVGVVRSVRLTDLAGGGNPVGAYYYPYAQRPYRTFTLAVKATDNAPLAGAIRGELARIDRELAIFDVRTMTERGELSLSSRRTSLMLAMGFGGLALFLAGIGIYGVLSYLVAQRRREIGIRMALGSTAAGIASMVLREGGVLVAIGLGFGLAAAALLRKAIESEIYGVRVMEPAVMAGVAALLAAIALVACLTPARRAAAVNPASVLSDS
jgi:predicted permease